MFVVLGVESMNVDVDVDVDDGSQAPHHSADPEQGSPCTMAASWERIHLTLHHCTSIDDFTNT